MYCILFRLMQKLKINEFDRSKKIMWCCWRGGGDHAKTSHKGKCRSKSKQFDFGLGGRVVFDELECFSFSWASPLFYLEENKTLELFVILLPLERDKSWSESKPDCVLHCCYMDSRTLRNNRKIVKDTRFSFLVGNLHDSTQRGGF